jgi:hypothetical protein
MTNPISLAELKQLTRTQQWKFLWDNCGADRVVALPDGTVITYSSDMVDVSNTGKTRTYIQCWSCAGVYEIAKEVVKGPGWHGGYGGGSRAFISPRIHKGK